MGGGGGGGALLLNSSYGDKISPMFKICQRLA